MLSGGEKSKLCNIYTFPLIEIYVFVHAQRMSEKINPNIVRRLGLGEKGIKNFTFNLCISLHHFNFSQITCITLIKNKFKLISKKPLKKKAS